MSVTPTISVTPIVSVIPERLLFLIILIYPNNNALASSQEN